MTFIRAIIIATALIFTVVSFYGIYALVICENHVLAHTFLAQGCQTDFLTFIANWGQIFTTTVVKIMAGLFALFLLLYSAISGGRNFLTKDRKVLRPLPKFSFEEIKTRLSILNFIFTGKLHPQLYAVK